MNPAYEFEDIEDYLEDRMSESDRQAFEQALETDAGLAQRVSVLKAEPKVFRLLRDEYLLEQFAEWDKEADEKKRDVTSTASSGRARAKVIPLYRQWWAPLAAVASLVGIIAAGIVFGWFGPKTNEPAVVETKKPVQDTAKSSAPVKQQEKQERLAEKTPLPSPKPGTDNDAEFYAALAAKNRLDEDFNETLMGADDGEETEDNYTQAVKLYSAKHYKNALKLLQKPESDQNDQYLYLRGYVYFQLTDYAKAEQDFRELRKFQISDRKIDAVWCEAICMVHQLPASRKRLDTVLEEITANPNHHYFKQASDLQQALEKR